MGVPHPDSSFSPPLCGKSHRQVEPDVLIFAKSEANALIVRTVNDDRAYDPGQPLHLRFPPAALHTFDAVSGARLP
ncbi:hypothetical protein [Mesorhizobium caraganae]|uniref:hypothetical protein n=1 Tax=Mesorhizobium caraganae TaxID=483206 RepID=UPI003F4FC4DD